MPRVRTTAARTALAALTALTLTACTGGDADSGAAVASGNPDTCPGDVLEVVVSVSQWSDVVRRISGDCATVTTIVSSGSVDPHDFEPRTSDLAAFSDADLVVVNGAHYDEWAVDAVATLDSEPAVVDVADVSGVADEGEDPHLWYEPEAVHGLAGVLADELSALSPDAATYFEERAATWQQDLRRYVDAVVSLTSVAQGRTFAATETVFDRMAATLGLTDVTPEGYRRAASNDSDPAPGDLAAFEAALADGSVDVLIYNTQTSGSVPEQLRAAAEAADVPVVEVTESPADADGSFVSWQVSQLSALSDALGGTP